MNDDRLRFDLAALAEEVDPVDLRDRALRTSRRLGIQRAVATSAAALVMIAAATGTALAIRPQGQGTAPQPAGPSVTVTVPPVEVTPSPSPPPTRSATPAGSGTASPADSTNSTRAPNRSRTASPPATATSGSSRLVFDPDGLGDLKLGMTKEQAVASGMIKSFQNQPNSATCLARAELKDTGGTVWWSTELGVAVIAPDRGVETVQGLHVGSSRTAVVKAYPDWTLAAGEDGHLNVKVPGNPDARYRIEMRDDRVLSIALQYYGHGCYE